SNFGNRPLPDPWEDVALEEANLSCRVRLSPARGELGEPLPRHILKGVCKTVGFGGSLRFAVLAGIDAVGQLLSGFRSAVTSIAQGHVRINAQRNPLLLAVEAVFQPPPFPTIGINLQIESTHVEKLERFSCRL